MRKAWASELCSSRRTVPRNTTTPPNWRVGDLHDRQDPVPEAPGKWEKLLVKLTAGADDRCTYLEQHYQLHQSPPSRPVLQCRPFVRCPSPRLEALPRPAGSPRNLHPTRRGSLTATVQQPQQVQQQQQQCEQIDSNLSPSVDAQEERWSAQPAGWEPARQTELSPICSKGGGSSSRSSTTADASQRGRTNSGAVQILQLLQVLAEGWCRSGGLVPQRGWWRSGESEPPTG